ncbi:hypothetical protein NBRC10512_007026 [Rhodotorula toruloides]|uniref:Zinc finger, MYND-type domain containing protein n=1 Tax=Rhodotorula toruloides (strain NP11) TaxID=1130832 RepID=M7WK56_RHOT1|nr:zinc finger, MYND-type domain containing protein [Rhodotorula toruloides NP11]EMS20877.1 zinc finger, MYND-type domain containing protein [Rhodotorula toruloides NP11]
MSTTPSIPARQDGATSARFLVEVMASKFNVNGCWVCGAPTSHKCSSCQSYGTDIRFCPPEHQKLVWPFHRQTCGLRSKPFDLPHLTDEQIARLVAHKDTRIPASDLSTPSASDHARKNLWASLARQGFPFDPYRHRRAVFASYYCLARLEYEDVDAVDFYERDLPVHLVAWIYYIYRADTRFSTRLTDAFLHRAVTAIAVATLVKRQFATPEYLAFFEHVTEQLLLVALLGIEFLDPDSAKQFAHAITWHLHDATCVRPLVHITRDDAGVVMFHGVKCVARPTRSQHGPDALEDVDAILDASHHHCSVS